MLLNLSHLSSLEVECTLVLEPPPVASHASNLFAVVIWNWVLHRGNGGVDTKLLDASVEFFFFHSYLGSQSLVVHIEKSIAQERT